MKADLTAARVLLPILCGLATPTLAQSAGFYDAWLAESLTLGVEDAAAVYHGLAFDPDADQPARLLAAARLIELHYSGGPELERNVLSRLRRLQPRLQQGVIRRLEAADGLRRELLRRGEREPGSVGAWLQTPEVPAARLESRPLLAELVDRLDRDRAGPAARRLLQEELRQAVRSGDGERARELRRQLQEAGQEVPDRRGLRHLRGYLILKRELEGRRREAEQLRRMWFPQPSPDLEAADLDLALRRLVTGFRGPGELPGEAELLSTLLRELRRLQKDGKEAEALGILARLPFYRQRLLRE